MEQLPDPNPTGNITELKGARYVAVRLLSRFERSDSYLDKLLAHEQKNTNLNPMDKALLHEIVAGVIRWKAKLDWVLTGFYRGDYQKCLNLVKNSMRVALYQITFLSRIPIPSAINESVEIVKRIQGERTAGIVNGVLRNIVRNLENVRYPDENNDPIYFLSVIYSHPKWIIKRWLARFGREETEKLLTWNNHRPNIPLRINTLNASTENVINKLRDLDIKFYRTPYLDSSLRLRTSRALFFDTDIFRDGMATVQDTSASLAAKLAHPVEGNEILDLCSAPGGKTFYMAELMNNKGSITALEKYPSKLNLIKDGADRLGLEGITTEAADATEYEPGKQFDIVFADVPCSGLGTLSKKPDIKWKREPEDLITLQKLQREIMENAAKLVKPGGTFLYSTCTIEPEENQDNIHWFIENHPDFEIDPAENYLHSEVCTDGFMQTFPHRNNCDGAFAARVVKKSDS